MTTDRSRAADSDVGKPIVDADGDRLGRIAGVTGNRIEIAPDPDAFDRFKARFGWKDRDGDTHQIDSGRVRDVTDSEVVVDAQWTAKWFDTGN
ncbi:hypothetical protein SAMN06269185_0371 [Natronoarchaeum philippinense]|uniref:Uncharacterized protein n=1 Tax=Natronoarchaeum philippinense TaxID=558529 RepID=A0A285N4D1_NATPI|nr:DUF2171 domain-containing protein [Natronoarchaeum philippinense]SNZ03793.1 hypothetical protein SAMN06269185_0371 [Natronoarchaeum philippinense]